MQMHLIEIKIKNNNLFDCSFNITIHLTYIDAFLCAPKHYCQYKFINSLDYLLCFRLSICVVFSFLFSNRFEDFKS